MGAGVMKAMCQLVPTLWSGFLVLVVLCAVAGCSGEPAGDEKRSAVPEDSETAAVFQEPEFKSLLPREAFALRERENNTLVVDVRTSGEREQVRIPGSVAVPLAELMRGQAQLPMDKPLLLVCAVGGRSYAAGLYLVKEQYPRVYNLRGGLAAWEKAGLPLEYGQH